MNGTEQANADSMAPKATRMTDATKTILVMENPILVMENPKSR
jgi:hypothetical protein